MNFFKKEKPNSPEELRQLLFDALEKKQYEKFSDLCQQNANSIMTHFPNWTKVPEHIRKDKKAVNKYANSLIYIATLFSESGYPQLLSLLTGPPNENPITKVEKLIHDGQFLLENGNYPDSLELLLNAYEMMKGWSGSFVDSYFGLVLGLLGGNYYHLNDLENAQKYTKLAIIECQRAGDQEGVKAYCENLEMIGDISSSQTKSYDKQDLNENVIHNEIIEAQDLFDDHLYSDCVTKLENLLLKIGEISLDYLPKIYGLLGSCFYKLKKYEDALDNTKIAIHEARKLGDKEAENIYQENLQAITRAKNN